MKEIIEQYGGAILIFVVVIALIGIMTWLLAGGGTVAIVFQELINNFLKSATPTP